MTAPVCEAPPSIRFGPQARCGAPLVGYGPSPGLPYRVETPMGNIYQVCPQCYNAMLKKGMVRKVL